MTRIARRPDELVAGIGDERRAGIADEGNGLATEARDDAVAVGLAAVVVIIGEP